VLIAPASVRKHLAARIEMRAVSVRGVFERGRVEVAIVPLDEGRSGAGLLDVRFNFHAL